METKVCTRCPDKGLQPLEHFHRDKYTKDGRTASCGACRREHIRKDREAHQEKHREIARKWYEANSERVRENGRKWREANPEKRRESSRNQYAANPAKAYEYCRKWHAANPGYASAATAKRRAAKLQRTPQWADISAIKEFFLGCPTGFHVDHIVPLQGKLVSGLHVLNNLQYLPAIENISKGNQF